ncbi:hypothetical protein SRB5_14040 [Streptomyces sp. RB5]|uniref:YqcI/YcgG family protein n=1 Tax=Streptomyces smaragdinus TaxID=2585196 RepID=A0A7K0CCV3_9ACTN|nr:guanitoxin biosynthesis heme-dependent pre-guanitoxin N-hydroxylase GntA [Streptomyces smaragdinus]MQY11289.1 hypothetical protein [Streptomyces smaragdinus]
MSAVDPAAVSAALEEFITEDDFVCLGARAALRRHRVLQHHYGELGGAESVVRHLDDLYAFLETFEPSAQSFTSFVATFDGPEPGSEEEFEAALWRHLQALHDRDRLAYDWCEDYDSDPASANFGFSVAGHPFFVVGLNPRASRPSRRFAYPALVFNSHRQFNALGINFFKLRMKIRKREKAFHGAMNPSFIAYKDEARHYGGRMTEREWVCPFSPKPGPDAATSSAETLSPDSGSTKPI